MRTLLGAAKTAGPSISAICDHIHRHEGATGVRRILVVLALARKHGPAVVEDVLKRPSIWACPPIASCVGISSDAPGAADAAPGRLLIRQLTLYRDLNDRMTDPE
jgi:hypothetical protein